MPGPGGHLNLDEMSAVRRGPIRNRILLSLARGLSQKIGVSVRRTPWLARHLPRSHSFVT